MFILSFFACSTSIDTFDSQASDALASSKEEPVPGDAPAEVMRIVYDYTRAGFVEARPFAMNDGAFVCGPPLFIEEFDGEAMLINLPATPPSADDVVPTEPVVYAIAQRDPTDEGLPGVYTGLAATELVWLPEDMEDGGVAGWNAAIRYGSEDVQWLEVNSPLLTDNLVGEESLTLEGTVDFPADNLRLVFETAVDGEPIGVWDNRIGATWFGTLPDVPPRETIQARHGMFGAQFGGFAYHDEDEDGLRTNEIYVGRLYADGDPVVVSWVAPASTFEGALSIRRNHARMGWNLYARTEDRLIRLNPDVELKVGEI